MVVCVDFALLVYFDIFALNSSGSWFNKVKKASQKKTKKKRKARTRSIYKHHLVWYKEGTHSCLV
jgi:hypothetical protein